MFFLPSSYVFLCKISHFFTLILLQLFSFRMIPGPSTLAMAVFGARTLEKNSLEDL